MSNHTPAGKAVGASIAYAAGTNALFTAVKVDAFLQN